MSLQNNLDAEAENPGISFVQVELKVEPLDVVSSTEDDPINFLHEHIDIKEELTTSDISQDPESFNIISSPKKLAAKKGKQKKKTYGAAKKGKRKKKSNGAAKKQTSRDSSYDSFVKQEASEGEQYQTPPYRETSPVPHKKRKIGASINYGSEDDTDEEAEGEGEDGERQQILVPRAARLFLDLDEAEDTQESQPYLKTDKHYFDWQPLPVLPLDRRTPFKSSSCGPKGSFQTPYDAFKAIWSGDIVERIADETNRYAQQLTEDMMRRGTLRPTSRIVDWRDATADEIYMFFAIVLATGVVVKSRIEEYWNKEPFLLSTPEFTNTMTYDRFMLLNKCLHFQDNDLVDKREMTKSEAKLFKLKPVIDHLNDKFVSLFNLGQNVALDESLTKWKGSSDINVFSRSSSASIGIKVYELCDCHTGYLWRFETKTESDTTPVETSSIMLRLLRGLEDRGHTIWMDSNYSSPLLARELKAHGFDCVGPLRTNKQYVPKQVKKLENSDLKLNELVGYTSGDVDVLAWRERKIVTLVSTYHGLATVEAGDSRKPAVMCDYVNWISKVDRKDQMLSAHPIERKRTRVWYKKFFRRLLNASVLNAYILHRHNPSNRQNPALSHREFRKTLIVEIIKYHMTAKASVNSTDHFPNEYGKNLESKAKKVEGLRRKCAVCKRRTRNYCEGCNTAMCLYACFKQHHSGKRQVLSDAEIVTGS